MTAYEITKAVIRSGLSTNETWVLAALATYADEHGRAFPGHDTIARDAKVSEKTVTRTVRLLKGKGILTEESGGRGRGNSITYRIHVSRIPSQKKETTSPPSDEERGTPGPLSTQEKGTTGPEKGTPSPRKGDSQSNKRGLPVPHRRDQEETSYQTKEESNAPSATPTSSAALPVRAKGENCVPPPGLPDVTNPDVWNFLRDYPLEAEPFVALAFLNKVSGSRFTADPSTLKPICARLRDGHSLKDLKRVIASRSNQWRQDERMKDNLRPSVLFGKRFSEYLGRATET